MEYYKIIESEISTGVLDMLPNPVLVKDEETRYVWVNRAFEALFSVRRDDVVGEFDRDLFPSRQVAQCNGGDLRVLSTGEVDEAVEVVQTQDGEDRHTITRKNRMRLSNGGFLLIGVMHDITDVTLANAALENAHTQLEIKARAMKCLAERDPLTDCYNRRGFLDKVGALPEHVSAGLAIFDLDHFKRINDLHGHDAGDAIIRAFVECASKHLRQNDVFARFGGEEFVLFAPDVTAEHMVAVASKIRSEWAETRTAVSQRNAGRTGDAIIASTVSVGVTHVLNGTSAFDVENALNLADKNLYLAKEGGRNRVHVGDRYEAA